MSSVLMNRARTLIIFTRPQEYAPVRVREAASHLPGISSATEEERRLASEAIEWLRGKRDEPRADSTQAEDKPKGKAATSQRRRHGDP